MTDMPPNPKLAMIIKWAAHSAKVEMVEEGALTNFFKDISPLRLKRIDMNLCNHLILATYDSKACGLWRRHMADSLLTNKQLLGCGDWLTARQQSDVEFIEAHSKWLLSTHNNQQEERANIRDTFSICQINEAGRKVNLMMAEYEELNLAKKEGSKGVHNEEKYWVATPTLLSVYSQIFVATVAGGS